jgi:hypothetical protein
MAWLCLYVLSLFATRSCRFEELANARSIKVRTLRESYVAMLLARPFKQACRIGNLRAANYTKLHARLAWDNRANQAYVAAAITVADDSALPVEILPCIRQDRANQMAQPTRKTSRFCRVLIEELRKGIAV